METKTISSSQYFGAVGSAGGFAYGLYHAYKGNKGFWGYVGYGLLFSFIGGGVGTVADLTIGKLKS